MAKMCSFGQEKNIYSNLAFSAALLHILVIAYILFHFCLVLLCFAFVFLCSEQPSIRHYLPMMEPVDLPWLMTMTMTESGLRVSIPMSECYLSRRLIHQHYHHSILHRCRNRHQGLHLHQMNYLSYRRSLLLNRRSMHRIYCWLLQFLGLSQLEAMLEDYWSALVARCRILYFLQHWLHRMPWATLSLHQGYHQFSKYVLILVTRSINMWMDIGNNFSNEIN